MKKRYHIALTVIALALASCNNQSDTADAYGNFEATEVTISAENNGKLILFNLQEGDDIKKGTLVGVIDTIALSLKKQQLLIQREVVESKSKAVLSQIKVLNAKLDLAAKNKERLQKLYTDGAATSKQLDEINAEVEVLKQSVKAVQLQNTPVLNELKTVDVQIDQLNDQLNKCEIVNPVSGTVLSKYVEMHELVNFGKPLYKIADLSTLILKTYIDETQLSTVELGQEVRVEIDHKDTTKSYSGTVSWIASESEFTPKIIQTKKERVTLVYALKITVINDGSLKIGMPAELWLND
jgi:HlyD family secretion protein